MQQNANIKNTVFRLYPYPAIDAVGYQGRKACKTTNALFMSDNQGVILGMATPQEGQQHDLFQIKELFKKYVTY